MSSDPDLVSDVLVLHNLGNSDHNMVSLQFIQSTKLFTVYDKSATVVKVITMESENN